MTNLKRNILILLIGALLAVIVFGFFKIRSLEKDISNQANQYELVIKDIQDFHKGQKVVLLKEKKVLELKVDSLARELLKINKYNANLETKLKRVLEELELVSEDSSYKYTQKVLEGVDDGPKKFGYSGGQVKEIHKTFILSDYKDSIRIQLQKSIGNLHNTITQKDNIIETLEFITDNYSVETDTLYNLIGDLVEDKQVAEEKSTKYKQQRNLVGAAALAGITVAIILSNF